MFTIHQMPICIRENLPPTVIGYLFCCTQQLEIVWLIANT